MCKIKIKIMIKIMIDWPQQNCHAPPRLSNVSSGLTGED